MGIIGAALCLLGRHDLRSISKIGFAAEHVGCVRCKREYAMNHELQGFLPWDAEFREFYRTTFGYDPEPGHIRRMLDPTNWTRRPR